MTDNIVTTSIEILGKSYQIRCSEYELSALQQAAKYLDGKMKEVQDSGKAINLERIAIIAALNITHEFLQTEQYKSGVVNKIYQHIMSLQDKMEVVINKSMQTELIYSAE